MTTKGWKEEVGSMMFFKREFRILLYKVANFFETSGEEFDEYFRHEFFEMTNSALLLTYSFFLTDRLRKRIDKYSILNDGNETKLNIKLEENESSMYDDDPSTLMDQCLTIDQSCEQNETTTEDSDDPLANLEHINVNSIDCSMDECGDLDDKVNIKEDECSVDDECETLKTCDKNDDDLYLESPTNVNESNLYDANEETRIKKKTISSKQSTSSTTRVHKEFRKSSELKDDVSDHIDKPFICDICSEKFVSLSILNNHKRIHRGEKPLRTYQCDVCSMEFLSSKIKKHMRTHTGEKPYVCELCGKGFSTFEILTNHNVLHTGEKPFECEECFRKFSFKAALVYHKRVHTGEKPHKCNLCPKEYAQSSHLKAHLLSHAKIADRMNGCINLVDKININKTELEHSVDDACKTPNKLDIIDDNVHEEPERNTNDTNVYGRTKKRPISFEQSTSSTARIVSSEVEDHIPYHIPDHIDRPFTCDICSEKFVTLSSMNNHKRIHRGEKPLRIYTCDVCFMEFTFSSNLTKHKRTHTGEKPYVCELCGKSYSTFETLTNHKVIHTGEKPFECDVCSKKFSFKSALKYHERVHTGIKPHKCDVCSKEFAQSSHLKAHILSHSREKPFKCDNCTKEFSRLGRLKSHKCTQVENNP